MEVVTASPGGAGNVPPYQRRDVEEWSHLDHLTGMLEHARVETDHWSTNTHNTAHKYGKVSHENITTKYIRISFIQYEYYIIKNISFIIES